MSLTEAVIVENVEQKHVGCDKLEKWSDTNTFCLAIFMLPTPEHAAASASKGLWCLVTTTEPASDFAQFQLAEWSIGWKEKTAKLLIL